MLYRFVELFFSLAILLASCELSGRLSNEFDDMNDLVEDIDWYLLPIKIQKIWPMIMMNAQQPVGFKSFGSYVCNRDTYKKVHVKVQ